VNSEVPDETKEGPDVSATVQLPKIAELSDAELGAMEPEAFAQALLDKAALFGADIMDKANYTVRAMTPDERLAGLREWNRKHAWLEWWLGVPAPSKQLVLLPESEIALRVRLAQQVVDEVKHQRVFSRLAQQLGGQPRFETYEPSPSAQAMYQATFELDEGPDPVLDIAATLQCTGEAVLMHHLKPGQSITSVVLDEATIAGMVTDVVPDEVRHVKIGADLVARFCHTPAQRRRAARIQDTKLAVLVRHYVEDHAIVGAERAAPLPLL
jgi:hypothetical protein